MENHNLFNELEQFLNVQEQNNVAANNDCNEEENENDDYIFLKRKSGGTDRTNDLLFKHFETLNIDLKIQNCAKNIYNRTISDPKILRVKYKNAILSAAIFFSYQINKDYRDHQWILDHFKITKKRFITASCYIKTCVPETRIIRPNLETDFFGLLRKLKTLDNKDKINEWIKQNEGSVKKIKKSHNKWFSMLYIWLIIHKNIIPTLENYSKLCKMSKIALEKSILQMDFLLKEYIENLVQQKLDTLKKSICEEYSFLTLEPLPITTNAKIKKTDWNKKVNVKKILKNLLR